MWYRYLINSHEGYAVEKKNVRISILACSFFSCSIWRVGYVLRIKRIRPDRYFRKLGKSSEYIAPVEESRRKGAKLRAQERENPFSAARLRSSPWSGGFQRAAGRPASYEITVKWGTRFSRISGGRSDGQEHSVLENAVNGRWYAWESTDLREKKGDL